MLPVKKDTLERLKGIVSSAAAHSSPLYREKYARAGFAPESIATLDDVARIPLLERTELMACPLWDRAFLPEEELLMCGYTSGTTSQELLPVFRNFYIMSAPDIEASRLLLISLQTWRAVTQAEWFRRKNIFLVCGDLQNPPVLAAIAGRAQVDAMYCTPTIAQLMAPQLKKSYDLSRIKTLILHGERISEALRKVLLALYPNASIRTHYASSEAGSIALSCPASEQELFHCDDNFFYEAVADGRSVLDAPGELVITGLEKMPTPLIRYRTGDMAELHSKPCPCGRSVFALLGRIGYDAVKVGGLELKVPAFEKGIAGLEALVDVGGYEVHVFDATSDAGNKPYLSFRIPTMLPLSDLERSHVIETIRTRTIIGPKVSIADAEARGFLLPSVFEFSSATERTLVPKKRAMLISHL